MKNEIDFALLCKELFFRTGKIGFYILASNIEKVNTEEQEETLVK